MKLRFLHDSGQEDIFEVTNQNLCLPQLKNMMGYVSQDSKYESAIDILKAYYSQARPILFDAHNVMIKEELHALGIRPFMQSPEGSVPEAFIDDFAMLFFTSGTTGKPVGAFKTRENLEAELGVLAEVLEASRFKKAIVTVPFIHFYGALVGLLLPVSLDIDLLFKEHFLPHELLDLVDDDTLVITTPLYIKALLRVGEQKSLRNALFVSSTAPLDSDSAKEFVDRFDTRVLQIYGSTETGGIAYKEQDALSWKPMPGVDISTNEEMLLNVRSPFVSGYLWDGGVIESGDQIQTFDYIERDGEYFKLIGRSSQIFKIAGKRYSTVQIENILEEMEGVNKALAVIESKKDDLKGEKLQIYLESKKDFSVQEIKSVLQKQLSNIKFAIELKIVETIPTSATGKKLKIG